MTDKQKWLYFKEVAAAQKAAGITGTAEREAFRSGLTVKALGVAKSSKLFTNRELDAVLGVCRALSKPASVDAQLRQMNQVRGRLEFRIGEQLKMLAVLLGEADAYVLSILRDRFGCNDVSDLSEQDTPQGSELEQFRMTLEARISTLRREAGLSGHELCEAAGVRCPCAKCRRAGTVEGTPCEGTRPTGNEEPVLVEAEEGNPF